jgi:hypothetical protein
MRTLDLLAATADRSVLHVTHELDGLDQPDEIVVLARGQVSERGRARRICLRRRPLPADVAGSARCARGGPEWGRPYGRRAHYPARRGRTG